MKTEELTQEPAESALHYDAHEFDGLRALEQEAQSIFAKGDQLVRQHPWLCIAAAVAAGFCLGKVVSRK
jgi:ElaB/YqjD/DUF883 family membrane-anchored ribosome-binding protein